MEAQYSRTFIFFGECLLNLCIIIFSLFIINNIYQLIISIRTKTKPKIHLLNGLSVLVVSAFSFLGFAIGLLVGFSISPVVQVVIPALLTFYGGFLTYLTSKDSGIDRRQYISVLLSAMAVSFFLIYGVEIGNTERNAATKGIKDTELYFLEKQEAIKKKYR